MYYLLYHFSARSDIIGIPMDSLTIVMAVIVGSASLWGLAVSLRDLIKKKHVSMPPRQEDAQALAKQLEERELFKRDSFEARLVIQNLNKELSSERSAHNILAAEHQSLKEQLAAIENTQHKAKEGAQALEKDFQKTREGLEQQYHKSLDEYEKLRKEYEILEKKCADLGFHKVAYEQLSQEHELLRKQLSDFLELHRTDQAALDVLGKDLESTKQTLEAEKKAQADTEQLEQLLEKQIVVQKTRAAEFVQLEQENKALKEQINDLKRNKGGLG